MEYFWYFIVYSFIGWIYEVLVGIIENHTGFVNRGFLFGPYLPIYGFGMLLVLLLFFRSRHRTFRVLGINVRPILMIVEITVFAAVIEYFGSYIAEAVSKTKLWDYSDEFMNLNGRIALIPDLKFGVGGTAGVYWVQPLLMRIYRTAKRMFKLVLYGVGAAFIIDLLARFFVGSNFVG